MRWLLIGTHAMSNRAWVAQLEGDDCATVIVDAPPIEGGSPSGELTLFTSNGVTVLGNVFCDGAFDLDRAERMIRAEQEKADRQ